MIFGSAAAVAAEQPGSQRTISVILSRSQIGYGRRLTVSGSVPALHAGETVALQFAAGGRTRWQTISAAALTDKGRFKFRTVVRESGLLRVLAGAADSATVATAGGTAEASAPKRISVKPDLRLRAGTFAVFGATHRIAVRGRLLPAAARRRVRLEGRRDRTWHLLATAWTGPRGRFALRFGPTGGGGAAGQLLRVRFGGDRLNARATRSAGRMLVFRQSLASWYEDAGVTACGFHAALGVAHRSLPCGAKVLLRYGGREVTAVVDDRGPFGGGRDWDLAASTASALGFRGVGMVWSTT